MRNVRPFRSHTKPALVATDTGAEPSVSLPARVLQFLLALLGRLTGVSSLGASVPPDVRANFRRDVAYAAFTGVFASAIGYFAVVARSLGAGEFLLAVILASPFIGHLFTMLSPYLMGGERSVRRVAVTLAIARIGWVAMLFVSAPLPFTALVVVLMVLGVMPAPVLTAIMQRAYPRRSRGRLLGAVRAVLALSGLLVVLPADALIDLVGHGPVFAIGPVAGLLGAAAFARIEIKPVVVSRPRRPLGGLRVAVANAAFRRYALAMNTQIAGVLVAGVAVPIVLVDEFDAPFTLIGVFTLSQGLAAIVGFRSGARWSTGGGARSCRG